VPEPAVESPLAELPILDPPRPAEPVRSAAPTERRNGPPGVPTPPSPPRESESTATILPKRAPGIRAAEGPQESATEAQLRMRRAELRTRVNLAIFAGGTLIMVVFAWLVIRFSRPG
jgi:hypothetical protein